MNHLETCIDRLFAANTLKNMALRIGRGDTVLYETYRSATGTVDEETLFDMASVTKILVTTSLCLKAMENGLLSARDKLSKIFPDCPADHRDLTVQQLLTHSSGIGGHKALNLPGNTDENIAAYILSLPLDYPTDTEVDYSCPGFILLGKILERIYGERLDLLFEKQIATPLKMEDSGFCPDSAKNIVNSNLRAEDRGVVNDYNCRFLGGIAGNAGLFSNMRDMTRYVAFLRQKGAPLISEKTFLPFIKNYTPAFSQDRGLGFLYVTPRYEQAGGLFPTGSFGHCGHTGQSVFLDPASGFYVILLTDATKTVLEKYGKSNYEEVKQMRAAIHAAIKKDLMENGNAKTF